MSGIYAVIVNNDDGGMRGDNEKLITRSAQRGQSRTRTWKILDGEVEDRYHIPKAKAKETPVSYILIGCAYSQSVHENPPPPVRSKSGRWVVVEDGVAACDPNPAEFLDHEGWHRLDKLQGNFALLAVDMKDPDKIFFATRGKPLYGLFDNLGRGIRFASQPDYFDGMYHPTRNPSPFPLGPQQFGYVSYNGMTHIMPMQDTITPTGTVLLSGGGLDTLVTAYSPLPRPLTLLYVNYGARTSLNEWDATVSIAKSLGAYYERLFVDKILMQSIRDKAIEKNPQAGVASEWMPGRNSLLMSIGLSYAESNGLSHVACGINMEAASAYPDNDPEWLNKWQQVVPYSSATPITLLAPLGGLNKTGIVKLGEKYHVSWGRVYNWSCYESGLIHCGLCSSCRTRRKAFINANVKDPTRYVV